MKIFIFSDVEQLTDRYHSGGGLVVVAENEENVKELIKDHPYIELTEVDWKYVDIYDVTTEVDSEVYVFPDAGCC